MLISIDNMLAVDQARWARGRLSGEKNDCAVSALACAFDMDYSQPHALLARMGRQPRQGTAPVDLIRAAFMICAAQKRDMAVAMPSDAGATLGAWMLRGVHDAAAFLLCGIDTSEGKGEGHVMALRSDIGRLYNYAPASVGFKLTFVVAIDPAPHLKLFKQSDMDRIDRLARMS